jgi:putative membrane protein
MMIILRLLLNGLAVYFTDLLLNGVQVSDFLTALLVAVVLGIANLILKPILVLLTLPITLVTLGLFTFVINAVIVLLVSNFVPGFHVDNFWWALAFSVVLSLINSVFNSLKK